MKKTFFLILCLGFSIISYSQDQTVNGALTINPQTSGSYLQGIRIKEAPDKWSLALFGAVGNSGTSTDSWLVGRSPKLNFVISRNSADGLNGLVIDVLGNVGIGTGNPAYKLDVSGTIKSKEHIIIGERVSANPGEVNRISITPYRHTGGSWNIVSRDQLSEAFLDFSYSNFNSLTFKYFNKETWVGIGTKDPQNKLDVAGTIRATEVKVETGWADFVFDKDYKLPTLQEVENHIKEHKHLLDIPSEKEVKENGVSLGEMQAKLLQKIEELTLYVIEQDKTIKEQGEKMNKQEEKIRELQTQLVR